MAVEFHRQGPVVVFGEAMIELADLSRDRARIAVGGDTYNTAVYLARAGIPTTFATALGADPFSGRIVDALRGEAVGTALVLTVPERTPGLYAIEVDDHGERSFTYWRSASAARAFFAASGSDNVVRAMAAAPVLYLSGITLSIFEDADRRRVVDIARRVRAAGGVVAFDTNYRPGGWASRGQALAAVEAIMPHVSLALPTLQDEAALFGPVDAPACAQRWLHAGADEVAVKSGPDGAFVSDAGWVPPPRVVTPTDTTGAGDSFNGAYLAARIGGAAPTDAALRAHRLAARVLDEPGAIVPRA